MAAVPGRLRVEACDPVSSRPVHHPPVPQQHLLHLRQLPCLDDVDTSLPVQTAHLRHHSAVQTAHRLLGHQLRPTPVPEAHPGGAVPQHEYLHLLPRLPEDRQRRRDALRLRRDAVAPPQGLDARCHHVGQILPLCTGHGVRQQADILPHLRHTGILHQRCGAVHHHGDVLSQPDIVLILRCAGAAELLCDVHAFSFRSASSVRTMRSR